MCRAPANFRRVATEWLQECELSWRLPAHEQREHIMQHLSSMVRRGLATGLLAAALAQSVDATTTQTTTDAQGDQNTQGNSVSTMAARTGGPTQHGPAYPFSPGSTMTAPAFAPLFVTAQDARAYWEMLIRSHAWPALDPRAVARSFIKERLGGRRRPVRGRAFCDDTETHGGKRRQRHGADRCADERVSGSFPAQFLWGAVRWGSWSDERWAKSNGAWLPA